MKKQSKSPMSGGEVLESAEETAKTEQYWILGKRSQPHKPPKDYKYVEELAHLQIELIKMQEWVRSDRKSTRLNSSHRSLSRMPSSA